MNTYYVLLVNGVPEQVTTYWAMAKQAAQQLESANREVRIVPCVGVLPQEAVPEEIDEEPTEPMNGPQL